MVFSSLLFLFRFLPIVLLIYYLVPHPCRNLVLLLSSLVFYAWGEPVYIFLMLISILVSWSAGVSIAALKAAGRLRGARLVLTGSIVFSLGLLGFFKYADFALDTLGFGTLGIALPIGISFYTFQSLSYTVDVYRGQAAQKNIIDYGAYIAMFPQLIAGPIVQYTTIDLQLRNRRESLEQFAAGAERFVIGLGKKVLLANNAGALWETVQAMEPIHTPAFTAWLGLAAYTLQIYFDFSGYSDMAIGLGKLLGFQFLENFNYPYTAKSITEFWRRWHISLGAWFREYVYIPLGGNRVRMLRHIGNLLAVWLLTGLWHGASWNFLLWGLYYGLLLILEKYLYSKYLQRLPAFLQHIYCLLLVTVGWCLFAFTDMGQGLCFMRALFGGYGQGALNGETLYLLYNHAALLLIGIIGCTQLPKKLAERLKSKCRETPFVTAIAEAGFMSAVLVCSVAWLVDAAFNPFLYFRF